MGSNIEQPTIELFVRPFHKQQNFKQAGEFYRSFDEQGRRNLIANFSHDLGIVKSQVVRETIAAFLYNADPEYGMGVAENTDTNIRRVKNIARVLMDEQQEMALLAEAAGGQ